MRISKKIKKSVNVYNRSARHWLCAGAIAGISFLAVPCMAMPADGTVSSGQGTISSASSTMTINQSSDKMVIDWKTFNLAGNEVLNITQPKSTSALLNRVTGGSSSVISGTVSANGQVYFVNPAGIDVTSSAKINAAGVMFAARNISLTDFAKGNIVLTGTAGGKLSNSGVIVVTNGDAVLSGATRIDNSGSITVTKSGCTAKMSDARIIVNSGTVNSQGSVVMTAVDADSSNYGIVEQSGTVTALNDASGLINITAGKGTVLLSGTTQSNGTNAGGGICVSAGEVVMLDTAVLDASTGKNNGGNISITASDRALLSGKLTVDGKKGGTIAISSPDIRLYSATLSSQGTNQGGSVIIGTTVRAVGSTIPVTTNLFTGVGTTIDVTGKKAGTVSLLSTAENDFYGTITATGRGNGDGKIIINGAGEYCGSNITFNSNTKGSKGSLTVSTAMTNSDTSKAATKALFGDSDYTVGSNRLVVVDSCASVGAAESGAVYLFSKTADGKIALLSRVNGSNANDRVGSGGIVKLTTGVSDYSGNATVTDNSADTGNFVIISSGCSNGTVSDAGAVTWVNGSNGTLANGATGGMVSADNSFVGASTGDEVGSGGVRSLSNGNYVVVSPLWSGGAVIGKGAVTWGDGSSGSAGVVTAENSLAGNYVGRVVDKGTSAVTVLTNGNYVVVSPLWSTWANGAAVNAAGAVTWVNGATGQLITGTNGGIISSSNSVVGTTSKDYVGRSTGKSGVIALANGNYVINSTNWDNGSIVDAGAITWGDGSKGTYGVISAANSLVGMHNGDMLGYVSDTIQGITALSDGGYVIASPYWDNGSVVNAGAVTYSDGKSKITGEVTVANSLVGERKGDYVGMCNFGKLPGVVVLANGNYVISSSHWSNNGKTQAGAVTWVGEDAGITGTISAANSLVGNNAWDQIGIAGVTALTNGNYVVSSPYWGPSANLFYGAATWGNGATGLRGNISMANSLTGSHVRDYVAVNGAVALPGGNYVVDSSVWNNGSTYSNETLSNGLGAVTFVKGDKSYSAVVSAANSLVGTQIGDRIGSDGIIVETNGGYEVFSSWWNNGTISHAGAITVAGSSGLTGTVSATNSDVGTTENERYGKIK